MTRLYACTLDSMLRIQGVYTLKSNLALNWYQHVENVMLLCSSILFVDIANVTGLFKVSFKLLELLFLKSVELKLLIFLVKLKLKSYLDIGIKMFNNIQ